MKLITRFTPLGIIIITTLIIITFVTLILLKLNCTKVSSQQKHQRCQQNKKLTLEERVTELERIIYLPNCEEGALDVKWED